MFIRYISMIIVCVISVNSRCSEKKPPNILFIVVDDLGWTDLGCYGSTFYDTPNIDQLAGEGMLFTQAYAANPDDPFFVFLSYYTVHTPIQANKEYIGRFEKMLDVMEDKEPRLAKEHEGLTLLNQVNTYYASMVYALDKNVGRLMQYLEEAGITEKTMIVFTSDNGGLSTLPENRMAPPTSVKPLRAGKGWCYEGGIRIPLIIKYAGKVKSNTFCDFPVISNDLYPTVLALAELPVIPQQHLDGLSLLPLLGGKKELDREAVFWHYPHYHGSSWTPGAAIRSGDWKLIEFYHWGKTELYNLKNDPAEKIDLSEEYPEKVDELKIQLGKFQRETNAVMPSVNPDYKQD